MLIGYINLHKCHHLSSVIAEWQCICPVSHILAKSCNYSLKPQLSRSDSSRLWEVVFPEHPIKAICFQNNYSSPEGLLFQWPRHGSRLPQQPMSLLLSYSLCLYQAPAVLPPELCFDAFSPRSHLCPPKARQHGLSDSPPSCSISLLRT